MIEVPEEEIICQCFQVSDVTINGYIKSRNLISIEQVTDVCGAGGGCQSCHMLLQLFIDQHHNKVPEKVAESNNGHSKKRGGVFMVYAFLKGFFYGPMWESSGRRRRGLKAR